jgi:uncharacterized protein (DUF4415 family)
MTQAARNRRDYGEYMKTVMEQLEWDLHDEIYRHGRIPPMWRAISETRKVGKKQRITLGVDENVAKFFRSFGVGYQARMNDVLSAWMYARLGGLLMGGDTAPEFREGRERPEFE